VAVAVAVGKLDGPGGDSCRNGNTRYAGTLKI
jgi:hypothetical protein